MPKINGFGDIKFSKLWLDVICEIIKSLKNIVHHVILEGLTHNNAESFVWCKQFNNLDEC